MTRGAQRGLLVIVSAPSGCGKTTIVSCLLRRNPRWKSSVSFTTRKARRGEKHARDYFFVTKSEFLRLKRAGFFLESACVFGHWYGTSRSFVEQEIRDDRCVILTIDVQGMKQVVRKAKGSIPLASFFILPPSFEELKRRLEKRKTDSSSVIEKRLRMAKNEMRHQHLYDYSVVNLKLSEAVKEMEGIIHKKCKMKSKKGKRREVNGK